MWILRQVQQQKDKGMLRFIKHNLTGINGVEIFPLLSLLIFVAFFAIIFIRVVRMKKNEISELSDLPFEQKEGIGQQQIINE